MKVFEEGVCEWFSSGGQSYGFIKRPNGGQIYVHYKQISTNNLRDERFRELKPGDKVRYTEIEGYRNPGTQAGEVEIIEYGTCTD